jgi:very-short-patch-repair endonuclease
LPKRPAERLALLDTLLKCQELSATLDRESPFLATVLGGDWRGAATDFALLHKIALAIKDMADFDANLDLIRVVDLAHIGLPASFADSFESRLLAVGHSLGRFIRALDLDVAAIFGVTSIGAIDLGRLADRAGHWAANPTQFEEWARLSEADRHLRTIGPVSIADALAAGRLQPARAHAKIEAAFAEASWKQAIAAEPELAAFDGERHNALVAVFRDLEARRRRAATLSVRARHQASIPRGALGGMAVIRGEIARKRNHMPLRKLMKTAGDTIQKIKPVFLMSPLSAAQYLPPGAVSFDLLIIDEASQVRPGDALGLIARCRQMVVVGDKKQLPPTQFFDRMIADDVDPPDEDEDQAKAESGAGVAPVSDLESILSLCEARGVEKQMLRWHYRSRHPSLIQVSNAEFYKRLVMPPAPSTDRKEKGLRLRRVAGAYDRGGLRTNVIEAEAIVAAAAEHARTSPALTLGIVTFSTAQRDLIGDRLEAKRRSDPTLDAFLRERGREDAFVKNLENVQGDERDVILISIGYGPRESGKPLDSMAFGPISSEGGERRLNVLFTRARVRCEIFASFGSGDINLDRATGAGPRLLKRFFQFAETGVLDEAKPTGADFDSPFEANVAAAIQDLGYAVEAQIGSAGFRIDLAVRDPEDPGRFMLAIECDGATYHSALWARERDRLRQEVLEGLGWRIHRIWSTDWFYRRDEQLRKLRAALEAAAGDRKEIASRSAPAGDEPRAGLSPKRRTVKAQCALH